MDITSKLQAGLVLAVTVCTLFTQVDGAGQTYRVTTIVHPPYVTSSPNTKFEGFVVDLLNEISSYLNISYVINHVVDNRFGHTVGNGTGMIGELMRNESDIAAASLTITETRLKKVYFSHPFINVPLRMLVKKPAKNDPMSLLLNDDAVFFFKPFTSGVWISIIIGFVLVHILLYVTGRFSPIDEKDNTGLVGAWCMTCSIISLQGLRRLPSSFSGRFLISCSFLFTIMLVCMYTATLVSFVSAKSDDKSTLPFNTFDELSRQTDYKYGLLQFGATKQFFMTSNQTTGKRIWNYVQNHPELMVKSSKEAIARVRQEKYVYIMEADSAYYASSTPPCDLMVVGDDITERSYGFACRPNTTICNQLNIAILFLKETGRIDKLKAKWWDGECKNYEPVAPKSVVKGSVGIPLDIKRFTIPLLFLVLGMVLSVVLLLMEIYLPKFTAQLHGSGIADDKQGFSAQMDAS